MARTSAALLVDSDLRGLESLVCGFQGVDWRSTACPAPETALLLVKASAADILVVVAREPYEETLTLLGQLCSNEETRALPLLVMGPASLRSSVLDCGAIAFLPTPVFVRDVITASRILVSLGTQHADAHNREPKIDGTLADFGFFSIIRVMSGLLRSGVLQVERANRRGEILFSEGEITAAQVGSLQGPPAIHHLLLWEDAKIELRLHAVARRAQFSGRFDQIMDEAERFMRDYAHAIKGIGPSSSVYQKSDARLASTTGTVPSEVTPLLRLFDGRRTLTDIIDESPFRVFDTIRILTRLVDVGVLTRRKSIGATPAPTPPLQKFWETARIEGAQDSLTPTPTPKPAPARVGQIDNRIGALNRRQTQRRALAETPVLGTPIFDMDTARASAAGAPRSAPLAAPTAQTAEANKARISGTMDLRATGDRREERPDRRARPSVSIDAALAETGGGISVKIDPGLGWEANLQAKENAPIESLPQSMAPPASSAIAAPPRAGTSPAPVVLPTTSQETAGSSPTPAASGSVSAAARHGNGAPSARVTGTLSVTPSQRSAAAKTLDKGASVELDPVLMAELGRLEKATTPMGPPESDQPLRAEPAPPAPLGAPGATSAAPSARDPESSPPKAGHAAGVTGTLSVVPSSRSSAHARKTPETEISVAVDPAFMAEAKNLDGPKPHSAHGSAGAAAPRNAAQGGAPGKARGKSSQGTTPAEARPTPQSPDDSGASQPSKQTGRISSAFNAVERDFFAREADLYKPETEDNFADLDEPAGGGVAKGSPGRGPSKRQA
jgi:hypothetical protein